MGIFDFLKKGEEKPVQPKPGSNPLSGAPGPGAAADNTEYYTVKSGDSLSKIAKERYGDAMQWRKIYEANTDQIKNPDLIQPGWKLKIPKA